MNSNKNSYSKYRKENAGTTNPRPEGKTKQVKPQKTQKDPQAGKARSKQSPGKSQPVPAKQPAKKKKVHQKPIEPKPKINKADLARQKQIDKQTKLAARQEKTRAMKESLVNVSKKAAIALVLLLLIGEAILMINQNAAIDELKFGINDLTAKLEKENNMLKELNSEKETAYKSENIENIARYNLGMVYPTKEQTIYINLD